jgi:hypothetical protein
MASFMHYDSTTNAEMILTRAVVKDMGTTLRDDRDGQHGEINERASAFDGTFGKVDH